MSIDFKLINIVDSTQDLETDSVPFYLSFHRQKPLGHLLLLVDYYM